MQLTVGNLPERRCIWFLEGSSQGRHPLFRQGTDGLGALQDFHKWRCMRLVHAEVFAKVDRAVWDEVFAKRPDLLQGAPSDSARVVCRKR